MGEKVYLGDGVYVTFDGAQLWLTTENGLELPTNSIALEHGVWAALQQYVAALNKAGAF